MQQAVLTLRVLLLLVRHPDSRSIGPLSRRSLSIALEWAVPRKSVVGSSMYVGITVTSFGTITYFSGRACPYTMSRRELLWKNRTSSNFSSLSTQCACSPLNPGASRKTCVRLNSVDFPAIFGNHKEQEESGQIDLRSSRKTSARNLMV